MVKGQNIACIHHEIHTPHGLLTPCWISLHLRGGRVRAERWWRWCWRIGGRWKRSTCFSFPHCFFHFSFIVQDTNGTILPNSVRDFSGVNPHCQLRWEEAMEESPGQAYQISSLHQDWVHFTVDADTPVTWTLAGLFGKPMLPVTHPQSFDEGCSVHFQLVVGKDSGFFVESH